MNFTANLIGGTGLVGKQLVKQLLDDNRFTKVNMFVRRDSGIDHPKLQQHIVDFGAINDWEKHLNGDVLFSTLGTTLKQAGSKKKQFEIDFTLNFNFAKKAKEKRIKNYILVSSVGANSKSTVFYTRIKGELDDAVAQLGFDKLCILRPSSLTGDRTEKRMAEIISIPLASFITKFIFKKYRPIEDRVVAKAMINALVAPQADKMIWENDEVFELAGSK